MNMASAERFTEGRITGRTARLPEKIFHFISFLCKWRVVGRLDLNRPSALCKKRFLRRHQLGPEDLILIQDLYHGYIWEPRS